MEVFPVVQHATNIVSAARSRVLAKGNTRLASRFVGVLASCQTGSSKAAGVNASVADLAFHLAA